MESIFSSAADAPDMRSAAALLVVLALVASVLSGAAVAQSDAPEPGGVTIDVHVQENGDARWNVSTRFALDTANETAAFERLAEDVEDGGDVPGFDAALARELAARGEDRTGRPMSIAAVEHDARIVGSGNNTTGVVTMTFTWRNFGTTGNGTVTVGDALARWSLDADQRIRLHAPAEYGINEVTPPPTRFEDGVLAWTGPETFAAGHPTVQYVRTEPTPEEPPGGNGMGAGLVAAVVGGALLLGGVAAYAIARRETLFGGEDEETDDEATDGERAEQTPAGTDADGDDADGDGADDAAAAAETETESAAEGADGGATDPELLSDEERVERLLEENGGRMKQADVVSETGWSNAKVSQLLSEMADADRVEKLRIGRENLISLPDATDEE
jgi:hypothetical protein